MTLVLQANEGHSMQASAMQIDNHHYLQRFPVVADVQVMLQVSYQGLADDNIIWAGVVVQLLMPLFHHSPLQYAILALSLPL